MGLFKFATGGYKFEYNKIISKHFNVICKIADENNVNFFDYSRISNHLNHQELSIVLFLLSIAITEESKGKDTILTTSELKLETASKVLKKFLEDKGLRSIHISTFISETEDNSYMAGILSQALFGRDYYFAITGNKYKLSNVLITFLDSLVNEWVYRDRIDYKNPSYRNDEEEELNVLRYTASIGDPKGQYTLAMAYFLGLLGLEIDFRRALNLAESAAEKDFAEAQLFCAKRYLNGDGTPQNEDKAKFWLNKAKNSNNNEVAEEADKILNEISLYSKLDLSKLSPEFLKSNDNDNVNIEEKSNFTFQSIAIIFFLLVLLFAIFTN